MALPEASKAICGEKAAPALSVSMSVAVPQPSVTLHATADGICRCGGCGIGIGTGTATRTEQRYKRKGTGKIPNARKRWLVFRLWYYTRYTCLRRCIAAIPTRPALNSDRVTGSGTAEAVAAETLRLSMLKKLLPPGVRSPAASRPVNVTFVTSRNAADKRTG